MSFSDQAAKYIIDLKFSSLPERTICQADICFKDWLGVALLGSQNPTVGAAVKWLQGREGEKEAVVLGKGIKVEDAKAALVNGIAGHVLDFDDIYPWGPGHPSSTVMPVVLALGEKLNKSGMEMIEAIVAGFQIQYACGEAIMPEHYQMGWHNTATLGRLGAAAAAVKLMGLDKQAVINALGIAATSAGGLQSVFGTMSKSFNAGKAAMDGMMAASLASCGFDSSNEAIDGRGGFWQVFARQYDQTKAFHALVDGYVIDRVRFKYYPSCYSTHGIIECMKIIRDSIPSPLELQNIKKIIYRVHPRCLDIAAKPFPLTGLEGKFSVQFCGAAVLLLGDVTLKEFNDELVTAPEITSLLEITELEIEPEFTEERKAAASVIFKNGKTATAEVNLVQMTRNVMEANAKVEEKFKNIMISCGKEKFLQVMERGLKSIQDSNEMVQYLL